MSAQLFNGDCLSIMPTLPAGSVDLILCDLPYGTTACAWDAVIPFPALWAEYRRIAKPNAVVALFGAEPFSSALRMSSQDWRYDWYWEKNAPSGFVFAKTQPMRVIETISIFSSKSGSLYNKQDVPSVISDRKVVDGRKNGSGSSGGAHISGMAKQINVQKTHVSPRNLLKFACVPNAGGNKLHPTQKPVALMEYLIRTYTNPGDVVLDNCMGSGTTGVAALNTGRRFIGIERDPGYFAICQSRIVDIQRLPMIESPPLAPLMPLPILAPPPY